MFDKQTSVLRKSICILVDSLGVGGRENVLIDTIKCLSTDYDITIAALYGISEEFSARVDGKATVITHLLGPSYRLRDLILLSIPLLGPCIFRYYVKGTYDYLFIMHPAHLMAAYTNIGTQKICWSHTDKDVVLAYQKNLGLLRKILKYRLKRCYRKTDATWVVTDSIRDAMRTAFGTTNIHTLENPIDCQEILSKSIQFIPPEMNSDCFKFIMVGRLSHEKGHIRALQALNKIQSERPYQLFIVGDGPEKNALEAYVKEHRMENRIVFVGHQSNPYPYILHANVMIQPSFVESFGLTMLEAMLLKTPVITTSTIGGIRVTKEGEYGVLVENSEEGLIHGLGKILQSNGFLDKYIPTAYNQAICFDLPQFHLRIKQLMDL